MPFLAIPAVASADDPYTILGVGIDATASNTLEAQTVVFLEGLPVGQAPEDARLEHVGTAVLGAEHVAVPALVASVGEDGNVFVWN